MGDDKEPSSIPAVSWCAITNEGNVVYYSELDFKFHMYSSLGVKLKEKEMNSQLNAIALSNDTQYVIAGGDKITLFMMRLSDFAMVTPTMVEHYGGEGKPAAFAQVPNLSTKVSCIRCSPEGQYIFLGMEKGEVFVVAVKA